MFPKLSTEKTEAGIFDSLQSGKLMNDSNFSSCMTVVAKSV